MILNKQSGYVLLSMLVLLLGVGSGWMGIAADTRQRSTVHAGVTFNDQQGLIDSRQALLSYAAIYPFLYGPAGAGAAHLPCPDSDGFSHNGSSAESGMNQRRDGPNPPCTSSLSSSGLLPRHVKLPGMRYAFHSQPWQRFHYEVSGELVNNPLNRIVNLPSLREQGLHPGAVISLPSAPGQSRVANVVLTQAAMIDASVAAVAAWIIQRSEGLESDDCSVSVSDAQPDAHENESVSTCVQQQMPMPDCEGEHLFELLLDSPPITESCLADNLENNTMEGVPATRHWFIRNQWHSSVVFVYAEGCAREQLPISTCKLTFPLTSKQAIANGSLSIELHWVLT